VTNNTGLKLGKQTIELSCMLFKKCCY